MAEDRVVTIDMLVQKILEMDKQYDVSKIISAYEFAAKAHEGQFRSSGQPYIIHPLSVAEIAASVGYPDKNYFARVFRKRVGMSPIEFRNRYQTI